MEKVASYVGAEIEVRPHLLRKLAHFFEYAVLGCLTALWGWTLEKRRVLFGSWGYAVLVALADEFVVQRLTEGRGPSFLDVLIDSSGAAVTVLLILALWYICDRRREKLKKAC